MAGSASHRSRPKDKRSAGSMAMADVAGAVSKFCNIDPPVVTVHSTTSDAPALPPRVPLPGRRVHSRADHSPVPNPSTLSHSGSSAASSGGLGSGLQSPMEGGSLDVFVPLSADVQTNADGQKNLTESHGTAYVSKQDRRMEYGLDSGIGLHYDDTSDDPVLPLNRRKPYQAKSRQATFLEGRRTKDMEVESGLDLEIGLEGGEANGDCLLPLSSRAKSNQSTCRADVSTKDRTVESGLDVEIGLEYDEASSNPALPRKQCMSKTDQTATFSDVSATKVRGVESGLDVELGIEDCETSNDYLEPCKPGSGTFSTKHPKADSNLGDSPDRCRPTEGASHNRTARPNVVRRLTRKETTKLSRKLTRKMSCRQQHALMMEAEFDEFDELDVVVEGDDDDDDDDDGDRLPGVLFLDSIFIRLIHYI